MKRVSEYLETKLRSESQIIMGCLFKKFFLTINHTKCVISIKTKKLIPAPTPKPDKEAMNHEHQDREMERPRDPRRLAQRRMEGGGHGCSNGVGVEPPAKQGADAE